MPVRPLAEARATAGPDLASFAAKRPSAGEGQEASPERTLPGHGDFDPDDAPNPSRLPEISGSSLGCPSPSSWHPLLDFAHRFTPQTDGKPDFAGFCPLLTSHSPSGQVRFITRPKSRNLKSRSLGVYLT